MEFKDIMSMSLEEIQSEIIELNNEIKEGYWQGEEAKAHSLLDSLEVAERLKMDF